jgi:hypothetical protein
MDLQPIGLRHPAAELIRDIQHNRTGLPRRMFVAEGLWEHNLLLASAPGWFVPADQLPAPTPTPAGSAAPSSSGTPAQ